MENPSGEKSDRLELISIGTLYEGTWDKKYWSSSRGKDRYPYPIGYHAVRTHTDVTYRMEIHEGLKGPLFVITCKNGESCSGQTPDIAWEKFQKKGPRVKLGLGKRFSCRIDGVELFGFRNPLVQRLLRELVNKVNGTAEPSMLSSVLYNEEQELEPQAGRSGELTFPNLLTYLKKPQKTRKRSRKQNLTTTNLVSGASFKRFQSQDLSDDAEAATAEKDKRRPCREGTCLGSSNPDEEGQVHTGAGISTVPVDATTLAEIENDLTAVKGGSFIQSPEVGDSLRGKDVLSQENKLPEDSGFSCLANELSKEEKHLGRTPHFEIEERNSLPEIEEKCGKKIRVTRTEPAMDSDICAPDTLEALQDEVADSDQESYEDNSSNAKKEDVIANTVISAEQLMDTHPEEDMETCNSNSNSEKTYLDSVGQEPANSMMTLLLPQALPLLKRKLEKQRVTIRSSEDCLFKTDLSLDKSKSEMEATERIDVLQSIAEVISPGNLESGMLLMDYHVEKEETLHHVDKISGSEIPNPECVKSVIPDSLEDSQFWNHVIENRLLCSDIVKDNQVPCGQKGSNSDNLELRGCVSGEQKYSDHVGTSGKNELDSGEVSETQNEKVEDEIRACNSTLLSTYPKRRILLEGDPMNIPLNLDMDSICPETQFDRGEYTKEELVPDCDEDFPSLDSASLMQIHAWTSGCESLPASDNGNCAPKNEPGDSSTRFQAKETVANPDFIVLSSEAAYIDSSAKNVKFITGENSKIKLIHYQRKHRSADTKLRNMNGQRDQSDSPTLVNQDNDAQRLSATRCTENDNFTIIAKEVAPRTVTGSFIQMPGDNGLLTESIISRNAEKDCVPDIYASTSSLFASEVNQGRGSGRILDRKVSADFNPENVILRCKDLLSGASTSEALTVHDIGQKNVSSLVNVSDVEKRHVDSVNELDSCCSLKIEPNKDSQNVVRLLGRYLHPTPILSILLSIQGDQIRICVLSGFLEDRNRTLFIYEVSIQEPKGGHPSFLGYTSIVLPVPKSTFSDMNSFGRCGWQFTPDGQYLVLLNSIKAPSCRSGSITCSCSSCTPDCLEDNAVKVVDVKLGYVALVTKLSTEENVHCVLVCGPSHLVAAEKNGSLHVWVMNAKWSASIEEFVLPSLDYISACIVELNRIPRCDSLIVGRDGYGNFGLWDISRRVLLSRFSSTGSSVSQILPVGLFSLRRKGPSVNTNLKEQIKEIVASSELLFSGSDENHALVSSSGEDMAVWLLVSASCDSDGQWEPQANCINPSPVGCWRLAILAKSTLILGSALDPRASAVDASAGYGILGADDGLLYMWELSTGRKLVDLPYSKGGRVSCITSDSKSGVVAVANDKSELLVYATTIKDAGKSTSK